MKLFNTMAAILVATKLIGVSALSWWISILMAGAFMAIHGLVWIVRKDYDSREASAEYERLHGLLSKELMINNIAYALFYIKNRL